MRILRILLAVPLLTALAACGSSSHTGSEDPKTIGVVAAENFWGDIAAQLGGSHVKITSIINDPEADPHLYESDAHDAAALADARIVVMNGLGYDEFVHKLLSASAAANRKVITVADVLNVRGEDANPHLWYDIPRIPAVARAIVDELSTIDPANAGAFEANLKTFDASLAPLNDVISQIKMRHPHAPVAYTERVAGYLLAAAELDVVSPPGFSAAIEEGNEPNASDTAKMNDLMAHHGAKALLYNSQAGSPVTQHVRDLARENSVPVVGVSETIPSKDERYQDWQLAQARDLLTALGG